MNCRYCGKAHASTGDACGGCGVAKTAETVSGTAPRLRVLKARVKRPSRHRQTSQPLLLVWSTELLIAAIAGIVLVEIVRGGRFETVVLAILSFFVLHPMIERIKGAR